MFKALRAWWNNLNENYKRIILSVFFGVIALGLGYGIYYVFFRAPFAGIPGEPGERRPIGTLPPGSDIREILRERGIEVEEEPPILPPGEPTPPPDDIAQGGRTLATPMIYTGASSTSLDSEGNVIYYSETDGKFYTIDGAGRITEKSAAVFENVSDIEWSPKGNGAILEFPDGSNLFYDFARERQYTLPKEAQDFSFSPNGNEIAYEFITDNPDDNWLVVSSPTGDDARAVEHIGTANTDDILTEWSPDQTKVAFFRSSAGLTNDEILFIGKNQENFRSFTAVGQGFEGKWSPDGGLILYNVYSPESGYRPELWVTGGQNETIGAGSKNIGLRTWIDKCVFADAVSAYCAVPLYLEEGTGIYKDLAQTVPDTIYKINLQNGFKEQIAIPANSLGIGLYSAEKLMLSPDRNILYLTDSNGGVYEIRLK
ncbi:MAG: hypothetical protein HY564_02445 [Candidatus Jacksonbacteria bacterium]|nr:hypothetical protein [Candidatus Jacksonbacteria bacterium]